MKTILEHIREQFDYVVIDTDTHFAETTLIALELADQIVAITTLEVTTINRVSQFFEVAERLGYPRSKIKLICNRVDSYYAIRPAQVEARLRTRFIAQIPEDNRIVVSSVNRGVPFVLAQKSAPISASVQALAQRLDELTTRASDEPQSAARGRRFGLF
jgi:pilus assembly protein CpaE